MVIFIRYIRVCIYMELYLKDDSKIDKFFNKI